MPITPMFHFAFGLASVRIEKRSDTSHGHIPFLKGWRNIDTVSEKGKDQPGGITNLEASFCNFPLPQLLHDSACNTAHTDDSRTGSQLF
jgi:hypothetical protein